MSEFMIRPEAKSIGLSGYNGRKKQSLLTAARHNLREIQKEIGAGGRINPERISELIEDTRNELPGYFRSLIQRLLDHFKVLDTQVDELELQIVKWHRQSSASSKLAQVPPTSAKEWLSVVAFLTPRCRERRLSLDDQQRVQTGGSFGEVKTFLLSRFHKAVAQLAPFHLNG